MGRVKNHEQQKAAIDPAVLGVSLCVTSAIIYAAANLCLRWLAVRADPTWAICIKESVSVAVVAPWLVYLAWRGVRVLPRGRNLLVLLGAGLVTQLGGNVISLWALGVLGLAVSIPLTIGSNLVCSALFGRMLLGERVSLRSAVAVTLLILAAAVLSCGAEAGDSAAADSAGRFAHTALALAAACGAGCSFSLLNVGIRSTVTNSIRPAMVVVMITGVAPLVFGPLCVWQQGVDKLAATPGDVFGVMLLAGLLNLLAFGAYTSGLRFTTVVHANTITASQTALAALGGLFLFQEPFSLVLLAGLVLTIIGVLLIDRPVADDPIAAEA
jgi:drug/metabolite transporter, DME family